MIELTAFDATIWGIVIASVTTLVVTPLAIRFGTPDKKENN